jgi:anti-anti-sigma factor
MVTRQALEATVRQRDGAAVIDLRGEIDGSAEAALARAHDQAMALAPRRIALNFTDVIYINSNGIALIVGLIAQARKNGQTLLAYGLSDHYREIFEVTRLSDFMIIVADEASAIERGRP